MKYYDTAVIGGGVLGCFAARHLRRWQISSVLIEAAEDVCTGITKSNTAIVYAGYDNQVGSVKAQMTVRGNAQFPLLCQELDVPFVRCGSLMVSFGPNADRVLQKKYDHGQQNGVPDLQLLSGREAQEREPMLADGVTSALYAPSTGTVNPWQLGIAAYENAVQNGCEAMLTTQVLGIIRDNDRYIIETNRDTISCRVILNCAGLNADKVQELLFPPSVRIFCDGADFLILDQHAAKPTHILFHESEEKGRGVTTVPTVDGNLLIGPSRRPLYEKPWATTHEGMDFLRAAAARLLPAVDMTQVIRSFASLRPNPHQVVLKEGRYVPDGKSIGSFVIENPSPGFYSLIGIKTPGLTCANELGQYLARQSAVYLEAAKNPAFTPLRKAIHKKGGRVVCQCGTVTEAEILEAIARGATTVDGVKRRVGVGMGHCQGSRCTWEIETLLENRTHGTV